MNYTKINNIADLKSSYYSHIDLYEHEDKQITSVLCSKNEQSYSNGKKFGWISYMEVRQERGYEKEKHVYVVSIFKRDIPQKIFETKKDVILFLKTIKE